MGLCPNQCGDTTLVGNPQTSCTTTVRKTTPNRVFFYLCDTTLPDPIDDTNIVPLFDNGEIVASMPLANVTFADPTYEEVIKDDCSVPDRFIVSREMTFEDRYAVASSAGSPAVVTDYLDYDFWQDKLDNQTRLNYMIGYCNGDVKVARDTDGSLLTASITAVLNYQRPANAGGKSTEFKQVSILFQGDPLDLRNKPEFNLVDAGINL
jgi:hypothetical protein